MIPHDHDIEAAQLMLQINQEQIGDSSACHLGYIGGVDPTTNKVQVVVPTWTNDDKTYMQTGWIPLGTHAAGNKYGIQLLPFGNATVTNPTGQASMENNNKAQAAEQVVVHVLNRQNGMYVTGIQRFNNIDVPPSGYDDPSQIKAQAGEWLFKHASGSYQYYANDGELKLVSLTNPAPVLQPDDAPDAVSQNLLLSAAAEGTNSNSKGDKVPTTNGTIEIVADANGGSQNGNSTVLISAEQSNPEQTAQNTSAVSVSSEVTAGAMGQANLDLTASSKGAAVDQAEFTLAAETQSTGTANGTINVDASTLGQGTLDIKVKGITGTLNINVDGTTNEMNITVTDGIVNLTTNIVNVDCMEANITAETSTTLETGTLDAVCAGNATIVSTNVILGGEGATRLLNDVSAQIYNIHTHPTPDGVSGTPNQLITPAYECQNVYGS